MVYYEVILGVPSTCITKGKFFIIIFKLNRIHIIRRWLKVIHGQIGMILVWQGLYHTWYIT
jgi:hypothetical protein